MIGAGSAVMAAREARHSVGCVTSVGRIDAMPDKVDPLDTDKQAIA